MWRMTVMDRAEEDTVVALLAVATPIQAKPVDVAITIGFTSNGVGCKNCAFNRLNTPSLLFTFIVQISFNTVTLPLLLSTVKPPYRYIVELYTIIVGANRAGVTELFVVCQITPSIDF
jgi:hypothetical protein